MSAPTRTTIRRAGGATSEKSPDDTAVHLTRLRWAVRATLTLGVAASVAANVLHARPNPISQIIAAWPPLALLLTVELISRVPQHRRSLGVIRIVATMVIAAIATWVSYWHLVGVAARYGETEAGAAYLLPISVDGLVIVASVSLVEITARIRAAAPEHQPPIARPEPVPSVPPPLTPAPPSTTTPTLATAAHRPEADTLPAAATPAAARSAEPVTGPVLASAHEKEAGLRADAGEQRRRAESAAVPSGLTHGADPPSATRGTEGRLAERTPPPPPNARHEGQRPAAPAASGDVPADDRRPRTLVSHGVPNDETTEGDVPSKTAAAVAYWYRRDPDLHPAEIAARIGRSERTVRRHWPPPTDTATPPVNGPHARHVADGPRR